MKDIKKIKQTEKEYLEAKRNNQNFNFVGYLEKMGYDSIDDYVYERDLDTIKDLDLPVYNLSNDDAVAMFLDCIKNNKYCLIFVDKPINTPIVFVGEKDNTVDKCLENDLIPYTLGTFGGTVVCQPGDVTFGIVLPKNYKLEFIVNTIYRILSNYNNNFTINGNDILLSGKKIAAITQVESVKNVSALGANISFRDSSDLIKKVCTKKGKTPGKIDASILTESKFINDFKVWLHKQ